MAMRRNRTIRFITSLTVLAALAAILAACGSSSTPTETTASRSAGLVTVSLEATPNPARTGHEVNLTIRLADAGGTDVPGAQVGIIVEHTEMSMGQVTGMVTDVGDGTYTTTIKPTMAGTWKVKVTADAGGTTKAASFDLPVT